MANMIRALVVDDERYSREELIHLLNGYSCLQIAGEAESGEQAIIKAVQMQPDVVFLDIEMPKMNGLETAKGLMELKKVPKIVFATAYPQFGAEAFRYQAVDYLLKPFDEEQLAETVNRLEKLINAGSMEISAGSGKLAIEEDGEIFYLDPNEIIYFSREEKVTKIVTIEKEYEVKTSLKEFEAKLKNYPFFRIHKSYLVHLDYVKRLTPWFNGAYQLEMTGREELLSVSRNYAKALRQSLEI